jgi:hypothetical protein
LKLKKITFPVNIYHNEGIFEMFYRSKYVIEPLIKKIKKKYLLTNEVILIDLRFNLYNKFHEINNISNDIWIELTMNSDILFLFWKQVKYIISNLFDD